MFALKLLLLSVVCLYTNAQTQNLPTLNQEELNSIPPKITFPQGTAQKLKCPYDGNPITYTWKSIDNNIEKVVGSNSKVFVVPSTYTPNTYIFECQASSKPGDLKSQTRPQRFVVEITKPIQSKQFDTKLSTTKYFGKMNSELELQSPVFPFAEKDLSWKLDSNSKVSKLYESNKLLKEYDYTCLPSSSSCLSLKIKSLTRATLGDYLRIGVSADDRTTTQTDYFVYGYDSPLYVVCNPTKESETCNYDPNTRTITVKENVEVTVVCSSTLYKGGDIWPNVVIENRFRDKDECLSNDESSSRNADNSYDDIGISKDCLRTFNRNDKTYTCILKAVNNTEQIIIERFDIKLNVQYSPTQNQAEFKAIQQKVSIPHGTTKELTCPYEGNPISYIWRHTKGEKPLSTNKTFTVPANYAPGVHDLECLAHMPGDSKSSTEPLKFSITITDDKQAFHKKYKNYIIAASVVGGVLLLGIVIAVVVVVVKKVLGKKSSSNRSKPIVRGPTAPHESEPLRA